MANLGGAVFVSFNCLHYKGVNMKTTIDMAREVDPVTKLLLDKKLPQGMDHDVFMWFLERFEAIVRADQRVIDARLCKDVIKLYRGTAMGKHAELVGDDCAGAILYTGEPND
jgi:hypothetical protein